MDKLDKYKEILQSLILKYAGYKSRYSVDETVPICDNEHGEYLLYEIGWGADGNTRTHRPIFHFRIKNGKVYVEEDNTDANIVGQMMDLGIEKQDIVLAFYSPSHRKLTDFAVI